MLLLKFGSKRLKSMPTRTQPTTWTPRGSAPHFPRRVGSLPAAHRPTSHAPPPPPELPRARQMKQMNAEQQLAELERLAQEWEAEAAALLQAHQAVKSKDHGATADGTSTDERAAVALNSQAANARKAIESKRRGEAAEAELAELKQAAEASLQAKIGALLHKRGVRADVVIRWAKSRDKAHRGQLAKAEFRTQILELGAPCMPSVGLPEVGLVATAAEVDALFDSFDVGRSGYMDLDEAKVAH